jgi:hypothetical protein
MKESEKWLRGLATEWNGTCLLGFSRGKDSIMSWLQLKKAGFTRIIPYYLKPFPDELSFETQSLAYYEEVFGMKIHRVLGNTFTRQINNYMYARPDMLPIYDDLPQLTQIDYKDIQDYVKSLHDLPATTYAALGVTQFDSFMRRTVILKNGPINDKKRQFFPIYDFTRTEIFDGIDKAKILLPRDYKVWGKTFDGTDYRFLRPLKDEFPADYEIIKFYFPLVDLELIRYEQV